VPESSARRIAFLGGSFDPPHLAHVLLATYVLAIGEVDQVMIVPVFEHAFGKQLASYAERMKMCELAFAAALNVTVSRIEEQMPRPNRTLLTLQRLQQLHPDATFRLVIGSDVLADTPKWHAFDQVMRLAPLLIVPRPGSAPPSATVLPDISSTQVRELLARRGQDARGKLAQLMPRAALDYALERGLYREA
jgi:nicotinate-nucleotide adenylyltransferase